MLIEGSQLLNNPKYAARAKLDRANLPEQTSYGFTDAGMYVLRNDWGSDQIYFALHCSPLGISGHDQADNGTFELYAYGQWLMPDTGFYTYGHDPQSRAWHRQTGVHGTLTLNGENSRIDGKPLLWQTSADLDVVVVENASYPDLTHRRTVWFVDKAFFVLLDEAIGTAAGELDLHFQLAPGDAQLDAAEHSAVTSFDDANVLVWMDPLAPVLMEEEEGWFAWKYGHRQPRKAFRYRHANPAPAAFFTVIFPFRDAEAPELIATLPASFEVGADRVQLQVKAQGKKWLLGRDLTTGAAWCDHPTSGAKTIPDENDGLSRTRQ